MFYSITAGEDSMKEKDLHYVGEMGENRLLTKKDLAGYYYLAKSLLDQDEARDFVYVGLGRSPVVFMEVFRQLYPDRKDRIFDLPLSIDNDADDLAKGIREVPYSKDSDIDRFLQDFLPNDQIANTVVVLIDYANKGYSLRSAQALLRRHIEAHGLESDVMIAPVTDMADFLSRDDSLLKNFRLDLRATHRLLKVMAFSIDKDYLTPYPRVHESDIRSGRITKGNLGIDLAVKRRLENIVSIAIEHVSDGKGADEALEYLANCEYVTTQAKRARRMSAILEDEYWGYVPAGFRPAEIKKILNKRSVAKSAEEYRIFSSRRRYWISEHRRGLLLTVLALVGVGLVFVFFVVRYYMGLGLSRELYDSREL